MFFQSSKKVLKVISIFLLVTAFLFLSGCASTNAASSSPKGFPRIYITTDSKKDVTQKTYYDSTIQITNCGPEYEFSARGKVKVRGNSTASGSEKPYRIKFDEKHSVLGLNKNGEYKDWVLLKANWNLIGDYSAFQMADLIFDGKYYASDCQFVRVYINNLNKGNYLLCEQTQIKKNRIDISEKTGFLLELDNYADAADHPYFTLNVEGQPVFNGPAQKGDEKKYPLKYKNFTDINGTTRDFYADFYSIKNKNTTETQNQLIAKYLNNVFEICYQAVVNHKILALDKDFNLVDGSAFYSSEQEAIEAVVDLDSLMNMFILEELVRNNDVGAGSFYLAVDFARSADQKYGRLTFEAPWDFNWAYEGSNYPYKTQYFAGAFQPYVLNDGYDRTNYWFTLMNTAPWFRKLIRQKWYSIGEENFENRLSQIQDFTKNCSRYWNGAQPAYVLQFLKNRIQYINNNLWLK